MPTLVASRMWVVNPNDQIVFGFEPYLRRRRMGGSQCWNLFESIYPARLLTIPIINVLIR